MELRYTFDPEAFYLGKICNYGHRWPGTEFSLRRKPCRAYKRNLAKPMKNDCAGGSCVACTGRKKSNWLLSFLDYEAMGWPANQTLGKLCPSGHKYNGNEASLRRWGACVECHRLRQQSKKRKTDRRWTGLPRAEVQKQYKRKLAKKLRAQGLTTKGRIPLRVDGGVPKGERNEEVALNNAIRAAGRCPSVARLVMDAQREYWRKHPEAKREHDRRWKKENWFLRYQTRPELRLYTRQKSKRRKALLRQQTAHQLSASDIRARFEQFGNCCAYCGASGDMQIEHVIAISKGGTHAIGNIVPACQECNYSKREKEVEGWYRDQPTFCEKRWRKICRVLGWQRGSVGQISLL